MMSEVITTRDLFPAPSLTASPISPYFWPGISLSSTKALQDALTDNHKRWHVYFNDKGFHNHASHFVITVWAFGADESVIEAAYKFSSDYLLPAFESPGQITSQNWTDYLGDHRYYNSYLNFFTGEIQKKDVSTLLEKFIFASTANFEVARKEKKQPEMLNRFLSGLIHPMLHMGYGVEFGLPGMVVEGLASTAIHPATSTVVIPPSLFKPADVESLESRLLPALSLRDKDSSASDDTHAFTIVARILKDPHFDGRKHFNELGVYQDVMKIHGEKLRKHVDEWTVNGSDHKEVERKLEELVWTNVIIYAIPGWVEGEDFNADFFHMHFVTSSIFLSSLVASISSPSSKELLLRSYFAVCLGWWIARGRPGFNIDGFFAADTAYPVPSGPLPAPDEKTLPSQSSPKAITPNPWLPIIQTAMVHPDEHVPKLQRALAHFSTVYGSRVPGLSDFKGTELPGAEKLDGTLFLRAAGLTAKRLGRVRDGEKPLRFWDRKGFFEADGKAMP